MSLTDTLPSSPHWFWEKCIGTNDEEFTFDTRAGYNKCDSFSVTIGTGFHPTLQEYTAILAQNPFKTSEKKATDRASKSLPVVGLNVNSFFKLRCHNAKVFYEGLCKGE